MHSASSEKTFYKLNKVFLYAIFLGLPLVINNGYFNISATKSMYFLLLGISYCLVSIVIYFICIIKKTRPKIKLVATDVFLIAFAVANIVSACLSKYSKGVWLGTESRLQGALIILLYVLVCFMVSNGAKDIIKSGKLIQFFAMVFIFVIALAVLHALDISIFGLFNNLDIGQRHLFISTIGNMNFFSSFICLALPLFVVSFMRAESKAELKQWGIVLCVCGVAAVLSCSDGFVLGFIAFLAVAPFFFLNDKKMFVRFWTTISIILLSAAAFYYPYMLLPNQIYEPSSILGVILFPLVLAVIITVLVVICKKVNANPNFLKTFKYIYISGMVAAVLVVVTIFIIANQEYNPTAFSIFVFNDNWGSLRGMIYRMCFEFLGEFSLKEWLVGIGPESLQYLFQNKGITYFDQAHCEYLQVLLSSGIFGLVAQLGSIIATVVIVIKKLRHNFLALAFFFGLIAYWAQALISIAQPFTTPLMYLYLAIVVCEYKQLIINNDKENKK